MIKKEHLKKNNNPFVNFIEDNSQKKKLHYIKIVNKFLKKNPTNARTIIDLTEDRRIILENNCLFLINDNYSSLGVFYLNFECLSNDYGTLYFNPTETTIIEKEVLFNYRTKNSLYRLIKRFEKLGVNNIEDLATAIKK